MKEYRFIIILVAITVFFLGGTMAIKGIQSYNEAKKEELFEKLQYDEPYAIMLEANENDVESLSEGIDAFRWFEEINTPDDKMIKKFNDIVTLYLEHEEVKDLNIHTLPDAQAMRYFVTDLDYINENLDYLGDSQKKMINKYHIDNLWDIAKSYENKEEQKNNPTTTITTTSIVKYEPIISMTDYEVIEDSTWGKPKSINKTETAFGVREQWVYDRGYLYFEDGYLTSIQSSR